MGGGFMRIPQSLREQVKLYERAGFHVLSCAPRSGAHFSLKFAEFTEPQIVTKSVLGWRSVKNNISRYRRLAATKEKC